MPASEYKQIGLDSVKVLAYEREKTAAVRAKEALILAGRELGASFRRLSEIVGLDDSTVSRRYDRARANMKVDKQIGASVDRILRAYDRS